MRGKTHCAVGIIAGIQLSLVLSQPITPTSILTSAVFSTLPDLDKSNSIIAGTIFKKKFSKFLYRLLIFSLNLFIFFLSIKVSSSFFISAVITFFAIAFLEKKLTHYNMRKSLITATLLLLALVLIISKVDISFVIPILVFSVFPWLKHRNFSHSILMVLIVYIIMNPLGEFFNYDSLGLMASSMYLLHIICDMFTKRGVAIFYPFSKNMISVGYIRVGGRFSNIIESLLVFVLILFTIYLVFKFV